MREIAFTILGEAASKANSRKIVTINDRPASIKSKKALGFEKNALKQIPPIFRLQLTCQVSVTLRMYYASERPDLDESICLDILQDRYATFKSGDTKTRKLVQKGVYVNDRQVREKHVYHEIDRKNPRVEIFIEPLEAQQAALTLALPPVDPLGL
jgi:Holliday junction resolvase RusA-like endonuclease